LADYVEVTKDVLLDAGVAIINSEYDLTEVYSQEILITHLERICSYDETRLELDCTRPGKGKGDRYIKAGKDDDGEVIVTKSSKIASAMCERLGDGRPLPLYGVFVSDEEHHALWTAEYSKPSRGHNIVDTNRDLLRGAIRAMRRAS
jgi:hypothetical protein